MYLILQGVRKIKFSALPKRGMNKDVSSECALCPGQSECVLGLPTRFRVGVWVLFGLPKTARRLEKARAMQGGTAPQAALVDRVPQQSGRDKTSLEFITMRR